jgi:hypothetical protein
MNQAIKLELKDILPEQDAVLQHQGIPKHANIREKTHNILSRAFDLFAETAEPAGMLGELSINEFDSVFKSDGNNAEDTPLGHIYPQAEHLALFASTMGSHISKTIERLFKKNDFALGSMIDAVASLAADKAAEVCEDYFHRQLGASSDLVVLGYSPGYCGWHISAQKRLFQFLHPEEIGMSLNNSYLMIPLKSVSGVLVAGNKEIHLFDNDFPFCSDCKTYSCLVRMKKLNRI